jgi:hypothetical protein
MARKSERKGRQKKRASVEAKGSRNQTQPAKSPGERESLDGACEVPEWADGAVEQARDIMDQVVARMVKEGKLPKRRK